MVYCPKCGQKVEEDYYFCPKCGTKIKAGTALVTLSPETLEAVRQALITAGEEMQKAFQKAAEEMQKGFAEARKEAQTRKTAKTAKTISCSNCGTTNPPDSKFCQKCGKPLS